ncbi:MAG: hypothetical protein WBO70_04435 [Erysipelotrichaceae bacterium]
MDELRNSGKKLNEEDVVMVTKDSKGRLLWLEIGDESKGLTHIIDSHESDFRKALGVSKNEIPSYLKKVIEEGTVVKNTFKNNGYESIFEYDSKYYVISGIGLNGFIISMYPRRK